MMGKQPDKVLPRVLLVYREVIPSITISALQPLYELAELGRISFAHVSVKSSEAKRLLLWCDVVICARNCFGDELPFLLRIRQLNIPFIYDCDDNFLLLEHVNDPSVSYLHWPGSMETVKAYMRYAFAIKVGSEQLAADCRQYNAHLVQHRYCFDTHIISNLPPFSKKDSTVLIGYAGSITHALDMKIALEAICRVLDAYENSSFICYGVPVSGLEQYKQRITYVPYCTDYRAFMRDFASRGIDIAIAPLYNTAANRSKTNNKYREYGACGIAGIYSDMPVYSQCVQDGENGLLCADDTDAWESALRKLIYDVGLRERIAQRAKDDVETNYTIRVAAENWWNELLLPVLKAACPVAYDRREGVLFSGRHERKAWLREQFTSYAKLMQYRLFCGYSYTRCGLKAALSSIGVLPYAKRLKAALLGRRLQTIKPQLESEREFE